MKKRFMIITAAVLLLLSGCHKNAPEETSLQSGIPSDVSTEQTVSESVTGNGEQEGTLTLEVGQTASGTVKPSKEQNGETHTVKKEDPTNSAKQNTTAGAKESAKGEERSAATSAGGSSKARTTTRAAVERTTAARTTTANATTASTTKPSSAKNTDPSTTGSSSASESATTSTAPNPVDPTTNTTEPSGHGYTLPMADSDKNQYEIALDSLD